MTPAPALDLTTSLRGDLTPPYAKKIFWRLWRQMQSGPFNHFGHLDRGGGGGLSRAAAGRPPWDGASLILRIAHGAVCGSAHNANRWWRDHSGVMTVPQAITCLSPVLVSVPLITSFHCSVPQPFRAAGIQPFVLCDVVRSKWGAGAGHNSHKDVPRNQLCKGPLTTSR